jgi:DNA helicase-2/ATP-dependent DNA helicase PcrA
VRDVVAYLKAIQNPADGIALARILLEPRRGIGDTTIDRLQAAAAERGETLGAALAAPAGGWAPRRQGGGIRAHAGGIAVLAERACAEVVQASSKRLNTSKMRGANPDLSSAARDVEELMSAARARR